MKQIKFWSIYLFIILFFQMLFIVIYNIPIYKIFCEINNYYLFDNIIYFIEIKMYLYSLSLFFLDYNNNWNNLFIINNYFILNNINILNNYSLAYLYFYLKFNFFFYDFFSYNFINIFFIKNELDFNIIYLIYFNTTVTSLNVIEFISLQHYIYVFPGETYISFFRIHNPTNYLIKGISIYMLSPFEINIFFYKIQCFCFDEIVIYSFESLELPILFFIDSNIYTSIYFDSYIFYNIIITYLFILNSLFIQY